MKEKFLPYVAKPGRYLGTEFNSIEKEWNDSDVRFALIFPDLYEIGMSHLGLQILYHILNKEEDTVAERCFCPDLDAEQLMKKRNIPPLSLESGHSIAEFDILGITLPYELCYSNILTMLDLANIPFYSEQRDDRHPLILGGGSCSLNPEPVAEFFDAILLGDGEEAVIEIAELIRTSKKDKMTRAETLQELQKIEGIYIPSNFQPQYDENNKITEISFLSKKKDRVDRRIIKDLDNTAHLHNPLVPNAKTVHDRLGVEIARGCTRGCRFCQAGMTYRPVRERTPDQIMKIAKSGIENSGFEELALLSLSTGDYSCIDHLLPQLMDNFASQYVSVSMPSMRVGTLSQPVMDQIKRVRKTGFTVAPEAGSERLRKVINKGITEEDLLTTSRDAFSLGWSTIKLYFMIGLPTETMEDVEAIADLALKTKKEGDKSGQRRRQINVSVGTFVPKPHTPFQWARQLTMEESKDRIFHLKKIMPRKGCRLKWHDPAMSFLEGVFSRGDRRLAALIEEAWRQGTRLDGWSEHFNLNIWQEAGKKCEIDLNEYLRERSHDEILPWHHLSSGIDESFFLDELEKSHTGIYTPDCRYHGCQQCGLCDFETLQPVVHNESLSPPNQVISEHAKDTTEKAAESHFKYLVNYSRRGNICYLGHLEILQLVFRSLRRANIRTNFSQGFNPSPKISFGAALPVGVESLAEYFIMDLPELIKNPQETSELLSSCLPEGLNVTSIDLHSGKIPQSVVNSYTMNLPRALLQSETNYLEDFLFLNEFIVKRQRKGKIKEIDIRPLISSLTICDEKRIELDIISTAGNPGIKAQEVLAYLLSWDQDLTAVTAILKTGWREHKCE